MLTLDKLGNFFTPLIHEFVAFLSYLEKSLLCVLCLEKQKLHFNRNGSDTYSIHDNEHNNVSIRMFGVCYFVVCLLSHDIRGGLVGCMQLTLYLNAPEMDHTVRNVFFSEADIDGSKFAS